MIRGVPRKQRRGSWCGRSRNYSQVETGGGWLADESNDLTTVEGKTELRIGLSTNLLPKKLLMKTEKSLQRRRGERVTTRTVLAKTGAMSQFNRAPSR